MSDTTSITIAGKEYNVPVRYTEGHELSAGEASALNQTFHENVRNNLAKKAKEGSLSQAEVDTYATDYQFGIRAAGTSVSRDPVMSEAMRIAKANISEMIRKAGGKPSDYEAAALTDAAKQLVNSDPAIMEVAKARLEEARNIAKGDLGDLLAGLTKKPVIPAAEPA